MSTPIIILILIAVGYLLGSMNSALVVSKLLMGYDIRTKGSGNAGLTNSLRVMGAKPTLFVLVGDIAKGVIACLIGSHLMGALGAAILARRSNKRQEFDFAMEDMEFYTREASCGRCPNNCEIICVFRDGKLIDSWGNRCERGEVKR